jgi:hypothetical protein
LYNNAEVSGLQFHRGTIVQMVQDCRLIAAQYAGGKGLQMDGAEECRWFRITDYKRHIGADGLGLQIIREKIVQMVQNYRIIAVQ